ncbi:hypothetical protein AB7M26_004678 [Pseudomonas sp. F-14 TE3482]|jgi:hypothetical protein
MGNGRVIFLYYFINRDGLEGVCSILRLAMKATLFSYFFISFKFLIAIIRI